MMEKKHTKAPGGRSWDVSYAGSPTRIIVHAHPKRIALCFNGKMEYLYPSIPECKANALLIAAAPDLLEACFDAYLHLFDSSEKDPAIIELVNKLCKATQKATGYDF